MTTEVLSALPNRVFSFKRKLMMIGPAFIAAIAYIDPGNFATNIQAGSTFGYKLLWVVLWSNLMAMLIQYLSAKLGIVTGKDLTEHLRERLPKWAITPYWLQAEVIAIATDLAEFIGAAVGFQLLFSVTLMQGAVITALFTFAILMLNQRGQKSVEIIIGGLLIVVAAVYIVELLWARPAGGEVIKGLLLPTMKTPDQVYLAAGILGATVMPHVIYLHSALFKEKSTEKKADRLKSTRMDVWIAMTIAGFVNIGMITMAAAVFHAHGHHDIAAIETAYKTLTPLLGHGAATLFGISLVASGLSSSVVGTMAGQVVMQGFTQKHISIWVRRIVTMLPSFLLIALAVNTTQILIVSQVVLSFGIAFALIPLLIFTNNHKIMSEFTNNFWTKNIGWIVVALVVSLNLYLLFTM
jgi:manganese transport protein